MVITSDGYVLTMFRIINPNINSSQRQNMSPVLFQHGLLCDSSLFLLTNPDGKLQPNNSFIEDNGNIITNCHPSSNQTTGTSLVFVLATCGYDVWQGNQRGNGVSNQHVHLSQLGN